MNSLSAITRKEGISILLIGVSFIAGFLAHHNSGSIAELFVASTPLYLTGLCIWTLVFHQEKTRYWWNACALILVGSLVIEIVGVETGFPFGEYQYGDALGTKFYGVPLVIAFNWLLLVYTGLTVGRLVFKNNALLQCLLGSGLVVLLDVHIEGKAPTLDYWQFASHYIPTINYIAWFVLSFVFQYLLLKSSPKFENKVAPFTFLFMFIYFMAFYIF